MLPHVYLILVVLCGWVLFRFRDVRLALAVLGGLIGLNGNTLSDFVSLTMLENNEDLAFVIPDEGSNWFVDAMCVLKTAQHKAEAEAWINFIASTSANLANMDFIWYASPNAEALAEYKNYYLETYEEELDEEIFEIMAAPPEVLERCEIYEDLPVETLALYNDLWNQLGI